MTRAGRWWTVSSGPSPRTTARSMTLGPVLFAQRAVLTDFYDEEYPVSQNE